MKNMMESQIWLNVGACVLAAVVAYLEQDK